MTEGRTDRLICPACQAENPESAEVCFACGKGIHALTQGAILDGRYEIRQALGTGGMGTVYLAHDQELDEQVAVKVLRPNLASSADMTARFKSEIKLARKVSHPSVCRIHDFGVDGVRHYISMEFVDGVDLRRLVQQRGGLPTEQAFHVAAQVCRGLQAIHDVGVIHRDLKASNIMVDKRGGVRLMDFGIAKLSGGERTAAATNMVVGTPEYMSPEQALGQSVDFRSDVYSLAVVIYETFTGRVIFEGHTPAVIMFMHVREPPPLDGQAAERLPRALLPLLRKALAKDPAERYATARGVAAELRKARAANAAGKGAQVAAPPAEPERPATGEIAALADEPPPGADVGATVAVARSATPTEPTARIDDCLQGLQDPHATVRWGAAVALWEIGPPALAAVPALTAALADSDAAVARAASDALKRITGASTATIAAPAVSDRRAADEAPQAALLAALHDGDVRTREQAVIGLAGTGPPSAVVAPLVRALEDGEPSVRAAAAASLVRVGAALAAGESDAAAHRPVIAGLVAALGGALKDPAAVVRRRAARGLGELGPPAQPAVPRLIAALQDGEVSVAHAATYALEAIVGTRRAPGPATGSEPAAPAPSPALSALIAGLKHADASVRWRAAVALGESGASAALAVPALVDLLDDEVEIIRWEAAKTLGKLGDTARSAVPALAATLHGREDAIVRRSAAEALGRIGAAAQEGVPALIAALEDGDSAVAAAAEKALLEIGRSAVPALIEAVKDDDAAIRLKAAEIVTRIGTDWAARHVAEAPNAAQPSSPWEGQRRSPRLDLGLTLTLRRLQARGEEGSEERAVTENISEGGAKLITSLPVEKGEMVELEEEQGTLRIRALVISVSIGQDGSPRLHLQFFEVDNAPRLRELLGGAAAAPSAG